MKVLNEKGKLFGLINIIDLGVLLVVLAIIVGGIWYMKRDTTTQTVETKDYYITLKCKAQGDNVVEALDIGDRFYYGNNFLDVTITDIKVEPARVDVNMPDGKIVVSQHPDLKDIYVTVLVKSPADEPMIYISETHATVGKVIALKTDRVEITSVVTKIEE